MSKLVGTWKCKLVAELNPEEDKALLEIIAKVQPHVIGAVWTPLRICYQIVNGINFKITYVVTTVTHPPKQTLVEIEGHMATDGTITRKPTEIIAELGTNRLLVGGWSPYRPVTKADIEVLNAANNIGVHRVPIAVSTQVVSGTNYHFICVSQVPGTTETYLELVTVYEPINGEPRITKIERLPLVA
ncbi:MAG: hypothetical protein AB8G11_11370 [Saprospiraceae bacterium]